VIVSDRYVGIAIVRSLGRRGIPVWSLHEREGTVLHSRYAQRSLYWPCSDDDGKIEYLEDLAIRCSLKGWMLFVTGDRDVKFVGQHYERLAEQYRLTSSRWSEVSWAYDKKNTYQLAADLKLDYPWTISPSGRAEVQALTCEYPVILKPSVKENDNRFTIERAWRVNNHAELLAAYDEACNLVDPATILIQEYIPGGGESRLSFGAFCGKGRPLATIVVRQLRQFPVEFGRSSTFVETLNCPEVESAAVRLISSANYSGCIEIEFKLDTRTGHYKILDVNPRLWGWHSIGPLAGVDLPSLQWKYLAGETIHQCKSRVGVRWIGLSPDVRVMLWRMRRGTFSFRECLRSFRAPLAFAMFAADDPVPAFARFLYRADQRWRIGQPSLNMRSLYE